MNISGPAAVAKPEMLFYAPGDLTVTDVLWVIEGMQLIDSNERTRLVSCFDMRCHSGHPGAAPITKYNVVSCFSDIVEIIITNPKFSLRERENPTLTD